MATENAVLMKMARESLKGKWGLAIGTSVVYLLIILALQMIPFVGWIASLVISGPMALGFAAFWLSLSRNQETKLELLFGGFNRFGTAFVAYLLMTIFTLLWMLLLIIPGIIAAYSYAMTYYIIIDDNSISASEAIKKSKKMMNGNKMKLFYLSCRFIGWILLCSFTFGIGYLWLIPYMQLSFAKFYEDIKNNQSVAEIAKS